ncbi:hypothetical protein ACQ7HM_10400 [Williamsia sp. MIQD14]|uniref:hypothetical protein n=1 Tax=Williamsia sp. MIQD14 TaxID=3425703 RepID=UPI003DA19C7D
MAQLPNSLVEGWKPSRAVDAWALEHGFSKHRPMSDQELREFTRENGGNAPGLYLWEDSEHHIYIGISERHVATRLRAHARNFREVSNIQSFRYLPNAGTSSELRHRERQLVHSAAESASNFIVMNREHAAMVVGESPLDVFATPDEQLAWLDDPPSSWTPFSESHAVKKTKAAEPAWVRFERRDDSQLIIDAVALYARLCVPFASRTEGTWWVVTCPGWKNPEWERVCTVSISYLEVLWFAENRQTGDVSVRVGTDFQFLPSLWGTVKLGMTPLGKLHRSGGPFEEVIEFESVDAFVDALQKSSPLRHGAARFALDRMRTGRVGRYRDSHSPQLAAAALTRANGLKISQPAKHSRLTRIRDAVVRRRLGGSAS